LHPLGGIEAGGTISSAPSARLPPISSSPPSFAFSQDAVIWVYLAEVFPTAVRARGQSIGSATHWIMNALIAWSFPVVAAHSRAAPLALFAGMMLVQLVTVLAVYPETSGITLEEMEKKLVTRLG
jgi:hypothetical protein